MASDTGASKGEKRSGGREKLNTHVVNRLAGSLFESDSWSKGVWVTSVSRLYNDRSASRRSRSRWLSVTPESGSWGNGDDTKAYVYARKSQSTDINSRPLCDASSPWHRCVCSSGLPRGVLLPLTCLAAARPGLCRRLQRLCPCRFLPTWGRRDPCWGVDSANGQLRRVKLEVFGWDNGILPSACRR